jgi:hypothetical protein
MRIMNKALLAAAAAMLFSAPAFAQQFSNGQTYEGRSVGPRENPAVTGSLGRTRVQEPKECELDGKGQYAGGYYGELERRGCIPTPPGE